MEQTERKTIMFVKAWMEPLRQLQPEERWNIIEAIMEYDATGELPVMLSSLENMAFTFIRADIDRMKTKYREVCDKRRNAANSRWSRRKHDAESLPEYSGTDDAGCNCITCNAGDYNKEEEKEEETETETETKKELRRCRSSKRSRGKKAPSSASSSPSSLPYDDSILLDIFFAPENQDGIASIAGIHNLPVSEIRRMAEEITVLWSLTEKTHTSYKDAKDAASHLVYSIGDMVERERRQTKNCD